MLLVIREVVFPSNSKIMKIADNEKELIVFSDLDNKYDLD